MKGLAPVTSRNEALLTERRTGFEPATPSLGRSCRVPWFRQLGGSAGCRTRIVRTASRARGRSVSGFHQRQPWYSRRLAAERGGGDGARRSGRPGAAV